MGWDACAIIPAEKKDQAKKAFKLAKENMPCMEVDGCLSEGQLGLFDSIMSLLDAVDEYDIDGVSWSSRQVKEYAMKADFECDKCQERTKQQGSAIASESAKAFLKTCAQLGVGIRFSI